MLMTIGALCPLDNMDLMKNYDQDVDQTKHQHPGKLFHIGNETVN